MIKTCLQYFWPILTSLLPGSPFRRLRNKLWRILGYDIALSANIMAGASLRYGRITIGSEAFVGEGTLLTGGNIEVGEQCDIAPRCVIHAGTHEIGSENKRAGLSIAGNISIGSGTWIGTSSTILAGANIGRGVIVAAGSVVTRGNYPDNVLLAGVPAKVIKRLS